MISVGSSDHGCVIVRDVFGDDEVWPVREYDVVLSEALLGDRVRRVHENESVSEAEGEDWSIA